MHFSLSSEDGDYGESAVNVRIEMRVSFSLGVDAGRSARPTQRKGSTADMVGVWRYSGDVDQAARLQAARASAGYETAREAAQRFGWAESRYVSHEGARRGLSDTALREYAQAFSVSDQWLRDGVPGPIPPFRDRDIEVDPLRVEQLRLRVTEQSRVGEGPDEERGRRLRLARRLAGFRSASAGAIAAGVHRSTLNGAERGLMGFDLAKARAYAEAFGCEPEWLLEGDSPTGYPPEVEAKLGELFAYHKSSEEEAASRLPPYRPPPRASDKVQRVIRRPVSTVSGEALPEHEIQGLVRLLTESDSRTRPATLPGWSMPRPFLERVLRSDANSCVVVAVPTIIRAADFTIAPGDRLIVDTSVATVFSAVYAVASGEALVIADARTEEGRQLANAASLRQDGMMLLGQIVGAITAIP